MRVTGIRYIPSNPSLLNDEYGSYRTGAVVDTYGSMKDCGLPEYGRRRFCRVFQRYRVCSTLSGPGKKKTHYPHHHPQFIDEDTLKFGVELRCSATLPKPIIRDKMKRTILLLMILALHLQLPVATMQTQRRKRMVAQ